MNYFLEFKKWVTQHPQEKNQVDPGVWGASFNTWSQEKRWVNALGRVLTSTNIPINSPLWVIHRWIASGGLPVLYRLSICWDRFKNLFSSWQSGTIQRMDNGQKLVEEIRELIRQHIEVAEYAINAADEANETFPDHKKGFYVANSKYQQIVVKGKVIYQLKDFTKINEQLNSLTLIFKPK